MSVYKAAFSFAGENRDLVEAILNKIQNEFSKEAPLESAFNALRVSYETSDTQDVIFYDNEHISQLAGVNLIDEFCKIYGNAEYVFGFVDKNYLLKSWTAVEQSIIKSRLFEDCYKKSFFIPIILDDSRLDFYPNYMGYIDGRDRNVERLSDIIIKKIKGTPIEEHLKFSYPQKLSEAFKLLCKDIKVCFSTEFVDNGDKVIFNFCDENSKVTKTIIVSCNIYGINMATIELQRHYQIANKERILTNFLADYLFYIDKGNWVLIDASENHRENEFCFLKTLNNFNELVSEIINGIRIFMRSN